MSWKDASKVQIRFQVFVEETEQELYITKSLGELLVDDDGGLYGVEQVYADAAEQVYGDHTKTDGIIIEAMEVGADTKTVYYAVQRKDGMYWWRPGSPTPALFLTEQKAKTTIAKHAPYWLDKYKIVKFAEVD